MKISVIAVALVSLAASPFVTAEKPKTDLAWISKVARKVRNGHGLSPRDDIQRLSQMSKSDIVDHFMSDPKFLHTVLDFNLYHLGAQTNSIEEPYFNNGEPTDQISYSFGALSRPRAVYSARALADDGDYFVFFDKFAPNYIERMRAPDGQSFTNPFPPPLPPGTVWEEERQKYREEYEAKIDSFLEWQAEAPREKSEECAEIGKFYSIDLQEMFLKAGFPSLIVNIAFDFGYLLGQHCFDETSTQDIVPLVEILRTNIREMFQKASALDPENYEIRNIKDLKGFTADELKVRASRLIFGGLFWFTFPNSSTNDNRKRAAYMLSRFFCDDLTPIGFVEPEEHAQGQHGSSPACLSCHYKLDPFAGFFKDIGVIGLDFSSEPYIVFDDGAIFPKAQYQSQWKTEQGDWNIGLIRSSSDRSLNTYGESFDDLFSLLRSAPETKACLVRRLSHFVLGEKTALDAGYIAHLNDEFNEKASENSSQAVKETFKKLILSRTFEQTNPNPDTCYDYAPGTNPSNRPPCRIAFLLEQNCAQCHGNLAPAGRLNLTKWIQLEDGTFNFEHRDRSGRQKSRGETLLSIKDRVSTPDENLRMPLRRHMSSSTREKIYLWANAGKKDDFQ